jgi:hypothetical protein
MTPVASAYRRPNGLTTALMILGGIDLVLGLSVVGAAIWALEQAPYIAHSRLLIRLGFAATLFIMLIVVKVGELIVRACWAERLVCNLHTFQSFSISARWAWAGFVVPIVSLWMPAKTLLALNAAAQGPDQRLALSCLAWAATRWMTSPTAGLMVVLILAIRHEWRTEYAFDILLALTAPSVISAVLGLAITPWIARRQPGPNQIHPAEVFG